MSKMIKNFLAICLMALSISATAVVTALNGTGGKAADWDVPGYVSGGQAILPNGIIQSVWTGQYLRLNQCTFMKLNGERAKVTLVVEHPDGRKTLLDEGDRTEAVASPTALKLTELRLKFKGGVTEDTVMLGGCTYSFGEDGRLSTSPFPGFRRFGGYKLAEIKTPYKVHFNYDATAHFQIAALSDLPLRVRVSTSGGALEVRSRAGGWGVSEDFDCIGGGICTHDVSVRYSGGVLNDTYYSSIRVTAAID